VLCVQELKANDAAIADRAFHARGFHRACVHAEKAGYSGVAIYSRIEPTEVVCGIGEPEFDREGRYVEARFRGVAVVSAYFPSGSSGPARQEAKFRFLAAFDRRLVELAKIGLPFVFCGDFNMAHRPIDLKNWRSLQDYPGFTPPERAWLDSLFAGRGFVDAFRAVNQEPHQYTWWSNRGQAWANNTGWRIDYQVVSPGIDGPRPVRAVIYKARRFSDHAPLIIDYEWSGVDAQRATGEAAWA
jgi:exodeoxyribonuclease-3